MFLREAMRYPRLPELKFKKSRAILVLVNPGLPLADPRGPRSQLRKTHWLVSLDPPNVLATAHLGRRLAQAKLIF
jgi:hypothetical protein